MARKYEIITELYQRTVAGLSVPQAWQDFLTTACRNFRLPFDEQVLVYAQRPDATAVLTIEGPNGWNQRFGRWVNRGATGIAVFDGESNIRSRLKYYFDISDTHESRFSRPVPLWVMRPEFESAIIETLENSFGELTDKADLASALLSAAQNAVEDNMADYLAELKDYKENSFLEELDDLNLTVIYRTALQNSIGYMLLVRCGIDPADFFDDEDFRMVTEFSTPETLNALGTATGDIGQMCLSTISRTTLALQRQAERQNGTFAPDPNIQYPKAEKKTTTPERSDFDERTDLHHAERLPSAEPSAATGAGGSPWEIRIASEDISEAEPQSDLHQSADLREAEPAPDRDRADSPLPDGADHSADGERRGRDGGTESQRSDAVDRVDEQHSAGRRGDGPARTDLPLESEQPAPQAEASETENEIAIENAGNSDTHTELPAFLDEKLIMAIIANKDDDLKYKKQQIELYFSVYPETADRAEYLQSAYQDRFTEILVDDVRVGYRPQPDGLLMWEGAYLSRTSESVFSWVVVAEWTAGLIEKKEYFINTRITLPKSQDSQQLSLFDFADFNTPQEETGQLTFMPRPQLPQQIIDEALCIGSNEEHSRLIICAYFMKDHTPEENAAFLQKHYGTNGAGFYVNDRQYAIWYNAEGIRIASGDTAQYRSTTLISWEQAATRIRELLELGRYMPKSELDRVVDFERYTLADRLALTARDMSEEAREAGYAPILRLALSEKGGFPAITEHIDALLADPEMLQKITEEWSAFAAALAGNRDLMRFGSNRPQELLRQLQDLQREPIIYTAAEDYNPQRRFFISADEIDKVLRGHQDYRLAVYSFYATHSDAKEREKYLKSYHGEYSGYYGGNDNRTYTGKGLAFSHGDLTKPYAKVELSWSKIAKRIGVLISQDRFLLEEDRAEMPAYEIRQLARSVHNFFSNAPELYPRPYRSNDIPDYWEGVQEVAVQLTDPSRVEEIYQMMLPLWEGTTQDDRYYSYRKTGLENMEAYRNGTYSVFGTGHTLRPLAAVTEEPVREQAELPGIPAETETANPYHTLAAELLRFYQEYDPYDYRDNMELGETDADALANLEQQLHNPEQRKGILDTLRTYLDDTDPEDELAVELELFMEQLQDSPEEAPEQLLREEIIGYLEEAGYVVSEETLDVGLSEYVAHGGKGGSQDIADFIERELLRDDLNDPEVDLAEAKGLINAYCMEVFDQEADYSDPSHVDLAYSATSDSEHTVEIFADLISFRLVYQVDGVIAYENTCSSLNELNEYLSNLDFDEMVAQAEEYYREGLERGSEISEPASEPAEKETPAPLTPPKPKRERVAFTTLHPEIPAEQRHNFRITDKELGAGTRSEKYAANVAAIRCLKQIEAEDRLATPEEQEILSRYVGWGGLADCFDERHGKYQELKSLLDEEEYAAARASSLTAFYTSPVTIGAMYQALAGMGFEQGNILEPSCGIGKLPSLQN